MKGEFNFKISVKNSEFTFTLHRNITIINDNSATGKSTLLDILNTYLSKRAKGLIRVDSDVSFVVCFTGEFALAKLKLASDEVYSKGAVMFVEEDPNLVNSVEFAQYVAESGNYFVIVAREPAYLLPYSTKEIYKLVSNYSKTDMKRYYTFEELYYNFPFINTNFDLIITEDSKSGHQFFSNFFKDVAVVSADGNSNVFRCVCDSNAHNILCIVDGAAFGAFIEKIYEYSEQFSNKRITVWLPESFEWVLLKAGVISFGALDQILENPSEYIDCKDYMSWERFFTHLAEENSDPRWKYTKGELDSYYCTEKNQEKVKSVMPKELQNVKKDKTFNGVKSMSLF